MGKSLRHYLISGLVLTAAVAPASAQEEAGNFALSFQGGAMRQMGEVSDVTLPLFTAGFEYYAFNQVAVGSQFAYAQTKYFLPSTPCFSCLGCCQESQLSAIDELYQSFFYLRLVEANHSFAKLFILGGPTINHVRGKPRNYLQASGSGGIEPVDNPFGAKLGIGLFIHFTPRWALNLTTALDTKPDVSSSAAGGLTVFLGQGKKNSSPLDGN